MTTLSTDSKSPVGDYIFKEIEFYAKMYNIPFSDEHVFAEDNGVVEVFAEEFISKGEGVLDIRLLDSVKDDIRLTDLAHGLETMENENGELIGFALIYNERKYEAHMNEIEETGQCNC